ncbi:T9SS type A sorting domain-containing protein [Winogradskyella undariae]|uniref:T9SS type A sorting domain-containing protein n=1 Tax=Winogradskyella undariae TaxID=1285465 RepID=UPI0015C9A119|nr:T9SS type A sorting domain-containing protein [Winogradskyella undariae]
MKKITLLFIFSLLMTTWSYGQCTDQVFQYPTTTVTVNDSPGLQTISTNNYAQSEYSVLDGLIIGNSYTVTTDITTYITVTEADGITVIDHGFDSISFVATGTGISIYWTLDAACTDGPDTNVLTQIECTSCTCTATSAPEAVTVVNPLNGATDVEIVDNITALTVDNFAWNESTTGATATSYSITLGLNLDGDDIGTLSDATNGNGINYGWVEGETYYWSVTSINCFGSTQSEVWSFTISGGEPCAETAPPACTTVISPLDNATNVATEQNVTDLVVSREVALAWDAVDGAVSYEITFDDGVLGETENTGVNIFGLEYDTTYTWSISPINCFGTAIACSTWTFTTESSLGIEDNTFEAFSVYPNPTSGVLNIQSTQDVDNVTVFNLLGQSVASFTKNEITNSSINLSELSEGLYLVRVTSGDKTETLRVTKK